MDKWVHHSEAKNFLARLCDVTLHLTLFSFLPLSLTRISISLLYWINVILTNDLDLDALASLEGYLAEFNVVLVTIRHERIFVDKVTEH